MQNKERIKSYKTLGLSYLIIACMFCAFFIITISFISTDELFSISIIENIKQFGFVGILAIGNIFISLIIGFILLFTYNLNELFVRLFVLALAFSLIMLDAVPIIDTLNKINTESNNTSWTIILLFIHLFLFISILRTTRSNKRGQRTIDSNID